MPPLTRPRERHRSYDEVNADALYPYHTIAVEYYCWGWPNAVADHFGEEGSYLLVACLSRLPMNLGEGRDVKTIRLRPRDYNDAAEAVGKI